MIQRLIEKNFYGQRNIIIIFFSLFVLLVWYLTKNNVEGFKNDSRDLNEKRIDNGDWTMFDKILYGGLGYGNICLPTHLFRVIATILFPPLGIIIKHIKMLDGFPWIDVGDFIMNIGEFIQSLLLTAFFYIPGLIYSLNQLKCASTENCSK